MIASMLSVTFSMFGTMTFIALTGLRMRKSAGSGLLLIRSVRCWR